MPILWNMVVAMVRCPGRPCGRRPFRVRDGRGNERANAARLGEGESLAVIGRTTLSIVAVGISCDVAEQVQGMGREASYSLRATLMLRNNK